MEDEENISVSQFRIESHKQVLTDMRNCWQLQTVRVMRFDCSGAGGSVGGHLFVWSAWSGRVVRMLSSRTDCSVCNIIIEHNDRSIARLCIMNIIIILSSV